jgi:HPt (histidine-containing phosphotransfer) domain-containing protein
MSMQIPGNNESITDLSYLQELSKGNKQFIKDMVKIFLEENPSEIGMLRKGIEDRDFNLINASAHKLRSTVPFVGIEKYIEEDITEIERLAVNKSESVLPRDKEDASEPLSSDKSTLGMIEKLFKRIQEVCDRACNELTKFSSEQ